MGLDEMHGHLLSRLWPSTRVVMGLRVCRSIRQQLLDHAEQVVLVSVKAKSLPAVPPASQVVRDMECFRSHGVSFALRSRCPELSKSMLVGLERLQAWKVVMLDLSGFGEGGIVEAVTPSLRHATRLSSLTLNDMNLGKEGMNVLAGVLQTVTCLSYLDLSKNGLGDDSMLGMSSVLEAHSTISHLALALNRLSPLAALTLSPTLSRCTKLRHLDLATNYLGAQGTEVVAEALRACTSLTCLNLSDNGIGRHGSEKISEVLGACTQLQRLELKHNRISAGGAQALCRALESCTRLELLELSGNRLHDEGAILLGTQLRRWRRLQTLLLGLNNIGALGAQRLADALQHCPALTSLDLSENPLRAVGTGMVGGIVRSCSKLARLSVCFSAGGDEGATRLAEALGGGGGSGLEWLSLRGCDIGDAGVEALVPSLSGLQHLTHLDLGRNCIRDRGARCLAAAMSGGRAAPDRVLSWDFERLAGLDLSGNLIRAEGGRQLREMQKGRLGCRLRLALVGNDIEPKATGGVHKQCSMPVYG